MAASSSAKITVDDVLLKRFFYCPAFEIYGGVGGLYDFGPPGCALKSNIIDYWRQHFILTENMLQVECTCVTPEVVLKASGHVDRFTDYMVRDEKGECYRADKYLEEVLDKKIKEATDAKQDTSALHHDRNHAGAMNKEQLQIAFTKWDIRTPAGQKFTEPFAFNLMFKTEIGPTGKFVGFLRPETAQGIFVNFRRLLEFNAGKMPFAVAQIGLAFRNEIAPRAGLLRVREFPMAEIEHFVNPKDKSHPRFASISNEILRLYAQSDQEADSKPREMTAGDAVKNKVINNETLAYYMTRTQLFLLAIGIRREKLRFRQHLKDEMAHYATDCWDAEIFMEQYGWVECVGHADRSAYDLKRHTEDSKVELIAQEVYSEPKIIQATVVKANAAKIGKAFKKPGQVLLEYFKTVSNEDAAQLKTDLLNGPTTVKVGEHEFKVEPDMVDIVTEEKKISSEKYIPNVIEPSFGLGRILYAVLEHSFQWSEKKTKTGEVEQRVKLSIPALVAPVKVQILPLSAKEELIKYVDQFSDAFTKANLSSRVDASTAAIGRRYARADELGTPFAITIDFDTAKDNSVTLRERDSTQQIRIAIDKVVDVVAALVRGNITWDKVYNTYPQVVRAAEDE